MDFDKVAVLDGGRLVEFDSPHALLEMPESAFAKLYKAAMTGEDDAKEEEGDSVSSQSSS